MNRKDDQIFIKYVQGIKPIKRKDKIKKGIKKNPTNIKVQNQKTKDTERIKESKIEIIKKPQYLNRAPKTRKVIKKGQISIDKKIDFHGKNIFQAEAEFETNVISGYKQKKRCLLFITGKGLHKQKNFYDGSTNSNPKLFYGKIREAFLKWVKKPEFAKYILISKKAKLEHGGDGAFYVYLRKNKN